MRTRSVSMCSIFAAVLAVTSLPALAQPGELLQQNTKLSEHLGKLLPAGTDLQAAAAGFKNLGQFVAAVHVSNNLGIPFSALKTRIAAGDSLGEAIKALKPAADSQAEVRRGQAQARQSQGSELPRIEARAPAAPLPSNDVAVAIGKRGDKVGVLARKAAGDCVFPGKV